VDALGQALDPRAYHLTLLDGRVLAFEQFDGFESITDLNGNVLSFASNGISHSSGKRMEFTPGFAGLAEVTTPDGMSRDLLTGGRR
jgi:hypothetical protein